MKKSKIKERLRECNEDLGLLRRIAYDEVCEQSPVVPRRPPITEHGISAVGSMLAVAIRADRVRFTLKKMADRLVAIGALIGIPTEQVAIDPDSVGKAVADALIAGNGIAATVALRQVINVCDAKLPPRRNPLNTVRLRPDEEVLHGVLRQVRGIALACLSVPVLGAGVLDQATALFERYLDGVANKVIIDGTNPLLTSDVAAWLSVYGAMPHARPGNKAATEDRSSVDGKTGDRHGDDEHPESFQCFNCDGDVP